MPAQLTLLVADCRGAVVLLHPGTEPGSDQFLFRHLARALPDRGEPASESNHSPSSTGCAPCGRSTSEVTFP